MATLDTVLALLIGMAIMLPISLFMPEPTYLIGAIIAWGALLILDLRRGDRPDMGTLVGGLFWAIFLGMLAVRWGRRKLSRS